MDVSNLSRLSDGVRTMDVRSSDNMFSLFIDITRLDGLRISNNGGSNVVVRRNRSSDGFSDDLRSSGGSSDGQIVVVNIDGGFS